jgi:hypothetical protein
LWAQIAAVGEFGRIKVNKRTVSFITSEAIDHWQKPDGNPKLVEELRILKKSLPDH